MNKEKFIKSKGGYCYCLGSCKYFRHVKVSVSAMCLKDSQDLVACNGGYLAKCHEGE